jgi:hypothetical protein
VAAARLVQFAVVIILALWLIVIVVKKGFLVFSQFYQIRFLKNFKDLRTYFVAALHALGRLRQRGARLLSKLKTLWLLAQILSG